MKKMTRLTLAVFLIICSLFVEANAQVGINADGSNPDASAILDVSSTDKGIIIPRMSSTTRENISNPANSLMVFDSTTNSFWFYDQNQWSEIRSDNQPITAEDLSEEVPMPDFSCSALVSTTNAGDNANSVVADDSYTYVLEQSELLIFDVSNPNVPSQIGSFENDGFSSPRGLDVSGNYAYFLTLENSGILKIVDISDRTAPSLEGSLVVGSNTTLSVKEDYAYIVSASSGKLSIVDISDPSAPSLSSSLDLSGSLEDIAVQNNYAYIVDKSDGSLKIVDISDETAPSLISNTILGDQPSSIVLAENYVYVVDSGDDDLKIIDVSDSAAPFVIGSIPLASPKSVAVQANYAYTVDVNENNLSIIDVSDPTVPSVSRVIDVANLPMEVAVAGNYAYVINISTVMNIVQLSCGEDVSNFDLLNFSPIDGMFTNAIIRDNQRIDKLKLNEKILEISLEGDEEGDRIVDLTAINTDDQTIDTLNLNGTILEISLENDRQSDQTVDLASINTDDQDLSFDGITLSITNGTSVSLASLRVPVGTIQMWPTSSPPTGWLICNGSSFSSSTYPDLANVLGGTTLPNFSGRFPLGVGNSGTSGSTNHNIGSNGGEEKHALSISEMPNHSHGAGSLSTSEPYLSQEGSGNQDKRDGGGTKLFEYTAITGNTASVGGGQAHNNMPPFYVIHFIIKAE